MRFHLAARLHPALLALAFLAAEAAAAAMIEEVSLPAGSQPLAVAFTPDGALWATLDGTWAVGSLDSNGTFRYLPLAEPSADPGDSLWTLRVAPDGTLWTASQTHVHRIDPAAGEARAWRLPQAAQLAGDVAFLGGKVLVTAPAEDRVAVLDPADGTFGEVEAPKGWGPLVFERGADALYVTGTYGGSLGRVDLAAARVVPVAPDGLAGPVGAARDGGAFWVAEMGGSSVARADPATGVLDRWPVSPSPFYPIAGPSDVLVLDDGVWIVEHFADRVARLDPEAGTLVEWMAPSAPGTNMQHLAEGPDGRLWFAQWSADKLASIARDDVPAPPPVFFAVRVDAGKTATLDVPGVSSASSASAGLAVSAKDGQVAIDASKAAPGTYRILVSTGPRELLTGRYVTVEVAEAAPGANAPGGREAPLSAPLAAACALSAALAWRRRS